MDIDSPPNKIENDDDDEEESSYNAELLELEPLREDSEDLLDDEDDEEDGDNDDDAQEDASNTEDADRDEKGSQEGADSSRSSEEDEDDDDAHVQGLTSNEREILTLLAVDKVWLGFYIEATVSY